MTRLKSARYPVETEYKKSDRDFPAPTARLLRDFPIEWDFEHSVGHEWRGSYEHFVSGIFKDRELLFVLKGTSYGRRYYLFEGKAEKPLFTVFNLTEVQVGLKAITATSSGELVEYLLHPHERIRKLATKLCKGKEKL